MSGSSVINKIRRSGRQASGNTTDLINLIHRGFPFISVTQFAKSSGLPISTISSFLKIPPRTLARRKAEGRLRPDESERLLRLTTIFDKAVGLFEGNIEGARRWLTRPVRGLGYEQPLNYAQTEVGAREVEHLIGRLEHGVFS